MILKILKLHLPKGSCNFEHFQNHSYHLITNRPFPSSLVPLFQSESKCETILMKMTLICMRMKLHAELIFIWMVSHLDSFWNRGTRELGNGLLSPQQHTCIYMIVKSIHVSWWPDQLFHSFAFLYSNFSIVYFFSNYSQI